MFRSLFLAALFGLGSSCFSAEKFVSPRANALARYSTLTLQPHQRVLYTIHTPTGYAANICFQATGRVGFLWGWCPLSGQRPSPTYNYRGSVNAASQSSDLCVL